MSTDRPENVPRAWYALVPPSGPQFAAFIDHLVARASRTPQFLLVLREREARGEGAALLDRLSQHLITEIDSSRWPGADLRGTSATLRSFRLNRSSGAALTSVGALNAFRTPLPEDLCFLAADGEPWLVSDTASDSFDLHLEQNEPDQLRAALPWLQLGPSRRRP